jgi:mRNA interferase HigB
MMWIVSRKRLVEFWEEHPAAKRPLTYWYTLAKAAEWKTFPEVKNTFRQTDQTKVKSGNSVVIFDIGGNNFRLIAAIHYNTQKLLVLRIFTHKQYDSGKWKDEL